MPRRDAPKSCPSRGVATESEAEREDHEETGRPETLGERHPVMKSLSNRNRLICTAALLALAPLCRAQESWSGASAVSEVNSAGIENLPCVSRDGLELRVIRGSSAQAQVWLHTRANRSMPFGPGVLEAGGVNPGGRLRDVQTNASNTVAYVCTGNVYRVTRPSPLGTWSAGTLVTEISGSGVEASCSVTEDELYMVFERNLLMYEASRTSTTLPWTNIQTLSFSYVLCNRVHLTPDGLTLYFSEFGSGTQGGRILKTTRPLRSSAWGTPVVVPNIQSTWQESDPSVTADGRTMYFSSNRSGDFEIYSARYTGLSYEGLPEIGMPLRFNLTHAGRATQRYQVAMSLSNASGISLPGVRTIPLDFDDLFILTALNQAPTVFENYAGTLDANGEATATFHVPPIPALVGVTFHTAFVTVDQAAVTYVSNGLHLGLHD